MRTSLDYDNAYNGQPFPICEIEISGFLSNKSALVQGLIDTGSDASSFPIRMLRDLGAEEAGWSSIVSITGISERAQTFFVKVKIKDFTIQGLEVIGHKHNDEIIIGRDILNQLIVELNGLAQITTISDRPY
ncbi:MAG: hypothetical protein AAF902_19290 [Chloroflexota bacterium]